MLVRLLAKRFVNPINIPLRCFAFASRAWSCFLSTAPLYGIGLICCGKRKLKLAATSCIFNIVAADFSLRMVQVIIQISYYITPLETISVSSGWHRRGG